MVGPLNQPQHPLFILKESVLTSQASLEKAGDKTGGGQAMSYAGEMTLKSLSAGLQSLYIGSFLREFRGLRDVAVGKVLA